MSNPSNGELKSWVQPTQIIMHVYSFMRRVADVLHTYIQLCAITTKLFLSYAAQVPEAHDHNALA